MGSAARNVGLVVVLALAAWTPSSTAEPTYYRKPSPPKQRITDPHYRYQQQHGDYSKGYFYNDYGSKYEQDAPKYDSYYQKSYETYSQHEPPKYDSYYKKPYESYAKQKYYYEDPATEADPQEDPHGYYDSYGHGHSGPVVASQGIQLDAKYCTVKFPGIADETRTTNTTFDSLPASVNGWLRLGCTAQQTSHEYYYHDTTTTVSQDDIGHCWFEGTTDAGIVYSEDFSGEYPAFINFFCHLKADKAKACNPGFETVNGGDKLLISGQGRVLFQYIRNFPANINAFNIVKDKDAPELIMNGFYNGQAQGTGLTTMRLLPLSRYNVGYVSFDVENCLNGNVRLQTGERRDLKQTSQPAKGSITMAATI